MCHEVIVFWSRVVSVRIVKIKPITFRDLMPLMKLLPKIHLLSPRRLRLKAMWLEKNAIVRDQVALKSIVIAFGWDWNVVKNVDVLAVRTEEIKKNRRVDTEEKGWKYNNDFPMNKLIWSSLKHTWLMEEHIYTILLQQLIDFSLRESRERRVFLSSHLLKWFVKVLLFWNVVIKIIFFLIDHIFRLHLCFHLQHISHALPFLW